VGIVPLLATAANTFFVKGLEYSVPFYLGVLAVMRLIYWKIRHTRPTQEVAALEAAAKSSSRES